MDSILALVSVGIHHFDRIDSQQFDNPHWIQISNWRDSFSNLNQRYGIPDRYSYEFNRGRNILKINASFLMDPYWRCECACECHTGTGMISFIVQSNIGKSTPYDLSGFDLNRMWIFSNMILCRLFVIPSLTWSNFRAVSGEEYDDDDHGDDDNDDDSEENR